MNLINRRQFTEVINHLGLKTGAEIGVREGHFSRYILANSGIEKWYAVDPWELNRELSNPAEAFASASAMFGQFGKRVEMVKEYSPKAADVVEDNSLDFIYIDGLHQYKDVKKDLEAWWPKLKAGGIFAGHDYCKEDWPGVYKAVNEFVKKETQTLFLTNIAQSDYLIEHDGWKPSWWFQKTQIIRIKSQN